MKKKYRTIVHVDMDAFFASIEQLDNTSYRGKPVVVGANPKGGKGRGVVSASSYEARRYGIHSAMPISRAYRLCPHAIFLRPRFSRYSAASDSVMETLKRFSPLVEPISIDEAFLDCTGTETLFGTQLDLGMIIKDEMHRETGLTASVGIASNKSIAKIASDLHKPDGLTICPPGKEREFLSKLPLDKLWGAGEKTVALLESMGFHSIGDIASFPLKDMERIMGKWGTHLWHLANGIDDRPVAIDEGYKSMSEEITFEEDVSDNETVYTTLLSIADNLSRRMRNHRLKGRTVNLKIRLEGFETYSRAHTLHREIDDMFTLRDAAWELYRKFDRKGKRVRLIGISMSNLTGDEENQEQLELFSPESQHDPSPKREKLEKILDHLRENFGNHVSRASLMKPHEDT